MNLSKFLREWVHNYQHVHQSKKTLFIWENKYFLEDSEGPAIIFVYTPMPSLILLQEKEM